MKKSSRVITAWVLLSLPVSFAGMVVENLRCEYLSYPLGIEALNPRLSWVMRMDDRTTKLDSRGQKQTAYRILVASKDLLLREDKGDLWDSGKVESAQSFHVRYQGKPLQSRQQCFWKVQVFDKNGKATDWSDTSQFEMGLLEQNDWTPASWIGLDNDNRQSPFSRRQVKTASMKESQEWESFPSPLFRREFETRFRVSRARAYICGLGYYELHVNGKRTGEQVLDPGQTTYDVRALYSVLDITKQINPGRNAIGIWLGNGFYGQNIAFAAKGLAFGPPVVICKIIIDYTDGSSETIVTDESWKADTGPVVFDNVYAGETYDARRERAGWTFPGYDDFNWQKAARVAAPCAKLEAQTVQPIKRMNRIRPLQVIEGKDGKWIFDLGQNISGWANIRVNEPAGTRITLRFAEILSPDGKDLDVSTAGTDATGVEQTSIYICKGGGWETWEPRFSYHGFRYVEVGGLNHEPPVEMLEGVHVRSFVESRGSFNCSNELLNRIYRTSLWTIEDNLHSVPEDCPHREKCAWLGDAHCMAETSIYNFDMPQFWTKFMYDIETVLGRGGETSEGLKATPGIPCNIAVGRRLCQEARPDWGAAIVLIPWYLYLYYEDTDVIAHHYEHMKRFVDYVDGMAKAGIVYQGYGDWCPPDGGTRMECPVELSSTAYHYKTLMIMERFAAIMGRTDDVGRFWAASQRTKDAFNRKFLDKNAMSYGSQTANAVALRFGLAPEGNDTEVGKALASEVVDRHQGHFWTGIHGSRPLFTMLCDSGFENVAYEAMTKADFPGFAFALSLGFTTWPEIFANSTDGRPVPNGSFNHSMQSGFAAWFHEGLGGIRPMSDIPGFKQIRLKPYGFMQIASAEAWHMSMYGQIFSSWKNSDDRFEWTISIPPNTTAVVYVPAKDVEKVEENGASARQSPGVKFLRYENKRAVYEVDSGNYVFKTRL